MRKLAILVMVLLAALAVVPAFAQEATADPAAEATSEANMNAEATAEGEMDENAYIRIAHFAPGGGDVGFSLDGEAGDATVNYQGFSEWMAVPAGQHNIGIGDGAASLDLDLPAGTWWTLAVYPGADGALQIEPIQENFDEQLPGTAYFTFVNAVPGGTNVDFMRGDIAYMVDLFPLGNAEGGTSWTGILDDTDTYTFRAMETGSADNVYAEQADYKFNENEVYLIALVGTPDAPEILIDSTPMAEAMIVQGSLEEPGTIIQAIQADERLTPIADAIESAGLTETLSGEGPYTVFIPAEFALDMIPADISGSPEALADFLQYHVVEGDLRSQDLFKAGTLTALNGGQLTIEERGEDAFVNDSQIIAVNIPATNGVIYLINQPLMQGEAASG